MQGNTKFCKNCGNPLQAEMKFCTVCGSQQDVIEQPMNNGEINSSTTPVDGQTNQSGVGTEIQNPQMTSNYSQPIPPQPQMQSQNNQNKGNGGKIVIIIIAVVVGLFLLGVIFGGDKEETDNDGGSIIDDIIEETTKDSYSFGETFEFDELDITIGKDYKIIRMDNEYSDYYNQEVVKLPITVKNNSSETHGLNMFYYSIYGSKGTQVNNLWVYYDDAVESAGDLRSGASYTKYIYFIYDGDGEYAIEFDDWSDEVTVEIEIKK